MATLSIPGVGSNLDVSTLVTKLMAVEQGPIDALTRKEGVFQGKLSALGTLKSALAQFQGIAASLANPSKFQASALTASDPSVVSATATGNINAGSYSLTVSKLAQAQRLATAGQTSTTDAIGNGVLTIDFGTISGGTFDSNAGQYTGASFTSNGGGSKQITINASNNSLMGIRDAINSANIGVKASIVNDGGTSPYRLALSATNTGKANSIKVSVNGDTALSNLLGQDPAGTQGLSETVTAQNAEFKVDGIAVSKSTNTISDVIAGVTLNLNKINIGNTTTLSVGNDTASVTANINNFVKAYNDVNQMLKKSSAYDPNTKQASVFTGDSTIRSIQNQLRNVLTKAVSNSGSFSNLQEIGVGFQKDGTLAVDNTKLQAALSSYFQDVGALFTNAGKASDSLITYNSAGTLTKPGNYGINITQLATQAKLTGSSAANLAITQGVNDALTIQIDGISSNISLTAGTYTADSLAAEVQSKINGNSAFTGPGSTVSVTQSGGVLSMQSTRYGSGSNVYVLGGNGRDDVVGTTPTSVDGVDVNGTINGAPATGSGQFLTSSSGNASGIKVQIAGGAIGNRGQVTYSQGYASQFDQLLNNILDDNGLISARYDGLKSTIDTLQTRKQEMTARLEKVQQRYLNQFSRLDTTMNGLNNISNFLQQQLSNLPGSSSK